MAGANHGGTHGEILAVFDDLANPHEPLATSEVADAVDCPRRTAFDNLEQLVAADRLETKKVGAHARVWWQPTTAETPPSQTTTDSGGLELTSEHVRELEFQSEKGAQLVREAGGDDAHTKIDGVVFLDDGTQLQYWVVSGIDSETYFETVDSLPMVLDARLLSKTEETFQVEVRTTSESLATVFAGFDGQPTGIVVEDDVLTVTGEVSATMDVTAVTNALRYRYPDIELVSQRLVSTPRLFQQVVEADLTDRQWMALQVAYYGGYFNWPRDSTGEELATHLGVTRQTFSHHLRHAEAKAFQIVFGGAASDGDSHST